MIFFQEVGYVVVLYIAFLCWILYRCITKQNYSVYLIFIIRLVLCKHYHTLLYERLICSPVLHAIYGFVYSAEEINLDPPLPLNSWRNCCCTQLSIIMLDM